MHYMDHVPISDFHRGENRGILVGGHSDPNQVDYIGVGQGHAEVKGHFYKGYDYHVPP